MTQKTSGTNNHNEFVTYIVELMQSIGPVKAKSMFGGYGLFLENIMFALISDNSLYFKVDKLTECDFIDRDLKPFTYYKKGKMLHMAYYQAPEETLEDHEEMNRWANNALRVALRATAKK